MMSYLSIIAERDVQGSGNGRPKVAPLASWFGVYAKNGHHIIGNTCLHTLTHTQAHPPLQHVDRF